MRYQHEIDRSDGRITVEIRLVDEAPKEQFRPRDVLKLLIGALLQTMPESLSQAPRRAIVRVRDASGAERAKLIVPSLDDAKRCQAALLRTAGASQRRGARALPRRASMGVDSPAVGRWPARRWHHE